MEIELNFVQDQKELIEICFRKARKEAERMGKQRDRLKKAKSQAIKRIEVSANYFNEAMQKPAAAFPYLKKLHPFYKELIEATLDLDKTLPAIKRMKASGKIALRLKRQYIGKAKALEKGEERKAKAIVSEFYGRLSSIAKNAEQAIKEYNKTVKMARELPNVRFDLKTVIIAGYPNTGKTTILGRLTKSKPKIAEYPFTTQKLQIGYLEQGYEKVQLIDTPGLLDRPLEKRNKIERKAIAALRHLANSIVFVADPTERCGFPLEKQANLLGEIEKELKGIPILVVLNKADIASEEEIKAGKKAFPKAIAEGHEIESALKEEIAKMLKNGPV
ncbi:MAG: 50S ribosome-binding GTPase [Candidatus Diapherotrites archaeon]|uniref:50S ribosome-binding GTPase n=1 Tax=Candidatus Iainarchaeum sp. TaxID=3101447 RepID=A0A938YUH4_9ARCH|nr:50S ribosome-binding GTPase [Candidatus Diapherotrites archaeon]